MFYHLSELFLTYWAWPTTILITVLLLRRQINGFISSLSDKLEEASKITYGDASATFKQWQNDESDESPFTAGEKHSEDEKTQQELKQMYLVNNRMIAHDFMVNRIKGTVEKLTDFNDRMDVLIDNIAEQALVAHFEKVYRLILGSQLKTLQMLNSSANNRASREHISKLHNQHCETAKGFNPLSFENFMGFLIHHELVLESENDVFELTLAGRSLLQYLVSQGIPLESKPF